MCYIVRADGRGSLRYEKAGVKREQTAMNLFSFHYLLLRRRQWQPTPVLLPGESHRQRSLAGYSQWGHKESDTTERLTLLTFTGSLCSPISSRPSPHPRVPDVSKTSVFWAAGGEGASSHVFIKTTVSLPLGT